MGYVSLWKGYAILSNFSGLKITLKKKISAVLGVNTVHAQHKSCTYLSHFVHEAKAALTCHKAIQGNGVGAHISLEQGLTMRVVVGISTRTSSM